MSLSAAVHSLIRPFPTTRPDGRIEQVAPLLTQLMAAVEPSSGGQRDAGADAPLPINPAPLDLWHEMQDRARTEQWHRTRDDSGGLWQIIETWFVLDDPDWEVYLARVALEFRDSITGLLDPTPKRRPLREPCPVCARRWVTNGDGERVECLTAGTHRDDFTLRHPSEYDVTCSGCGAEWHGQALTEVLPQVAGHADDMEPAR